MKKTQIDTVYNFNSLCPLPALSKHSESKGGYNKKSVSPVLSEVEGIRVNPWLAKTLFIVSLVSLVFAFGCDGGKAGKPTTAQQAQTLASQNTELQNQLELAQAENAQLVKQSESLAKLPGDKRADAIYHLKSVKLGNYTNFYDANKTPAATGKKKLVVYVQPIDETGDTIKAGGAIEVELWDLNKKENEARLAQWQVEPNELKTLWLSGMLSSGYRLTFDAAAIVDKFDKPLTVKVNFTDYLSGMTFTEQFIIRPPVLSKRSASKGQSSE